MAQDNGVKSISEKFLDTNDVFGLKFNNGFVFLQVEGWEQVKFAPFDSVGDIPGGSQVDFDRLNFDGDDVLYTEKEELKVKHVGIGHTPAKVRRYTNYPEAQNRLRKLANLGAPTAGDDWGYIDGEDSPYANPTDAEELWVVPGTRLDFSFYNPDNEPTRPKLNILMREYNIRALDPTDSSNKGAISKVISPGSPAPIGFAGSPDSQVKFELGNYWGVSPVSRKDAVRQISGGR
jgi:hypothetical protein